MGETHSADRRPDVTAQGAGPSKWPSTAGVPVSDPTPEDRRGYPEVPGYEILGILGHGGMGVVYQARQVKANRLTALKMIRAVEHASPNDRLRFQIETEAVARLQHPNIVQLHEVGEVRGLPFFSLEFCDGGTLAEQLKKKRPSPRESAELIETLARAMHYAHLRGVVHRDLKPGNVLLTADGTPKISDFGLAKRIDAEARDVSKSGAIMGTASYMAPEQAAGRVHDTGPAADVYGLGALLYECLTGRPPFEGPQHVVLLSVMSDEPTSPSHLNPKVPRDLETICLKCLSKEPTRRYADAEALAEDLRRFQAGEPVHARSVGRLERVVKWAKRRPAAAALMGVILAALVSLAVLSGHLVEARNDAVEKERLARQEAEKATKAREFLVDIFRVSDPNRAGGTMTARQIIDNADQRIPREFENQPELRRELLADIEKIYSDQTRTAPLAMILESRGSVTLHPSREPKRKAVAQTLLYAGDRLSLGDDAKVLLVVLHDLHQERLRPGVEATIRRKGCEPADAVAERIDDIMMTFVPMKKGTFFMGWQGTKVDLPTKIEADYEIAVHDVTQGQWQAIMGDNPAHFSRFGAGRKDVNDISDEELKLFPMENVSWNDAQEFIKKLNEKMNKRGWLYRLPTEAEWEYACRGGATTVQECSHHYYLAEPTNILSSEQANFNGELSSGNDKKGPYLGRPTRVGAYPSNKLGLCDMHGNVWQWCADQMAVRNPARALRGGGWGTAGNGCRATSRSGGVPNYRDYLRGFRLVRVPVR